MSVIGSSQWARRRRSRCRAEVAGGAGRPLHESASPKLTWSRGRDVFAPARTGARWSRPRRPSHRHALPRSSPRTTTGARGSSACYRGMAERRGGSERRAARRAGARDRSGANVIVLGAAPVPRRARDRAQIKDAREGLGRAYSRRDSPHGPRTLLRPGRPCSSSPRRDTETEDRRSQDPRRKRAPGCLRVKKTRGRGEAREAVSEELCRRSRPIRLVSRGIAAARRTRAPHWARPERHAGLAKGRGLCSVALRRLAGGVFLGASCGGIDGQR